MVKLLGPLCSIHATGHLPGGPTYLTTRTYTAARKHSPPSNPASPLQVSTRAIYGFLARAWPDLADPARQSWDPLAEPRELLPYNAYLSDGLLRWRQYRAPTSTYPADETTPIVSVILLSATGGTAHVDLLYNVLYPPFTWGLLIHQSADPLFDTSRSNCVAAIAPTTGGPSTYTHHGVPAGTWHYRTRTINYLGRLGPQSPVRSATVT